MPKRITVPWGTLVVPDDATDQEIEDAANASDPQSPNAMAARIGTPEERVRAENTAWSQDRLMKGADAPLMRVDGTLARSKGLLGGNDAKMDVPPMAERAMNAVGLGDRYVQARQLLPAVAGAAATAGVAALALPAAPILAPLLAGAAATGATSFGLGASPKQALKDGATELATGGAMVGGGKILKAGGEHFYRSALLNSGAKAEDAARLTPVGIREGINVSQGGGKEAMARAARIHEALTDNIAKIEGQTIDPKVGFNNIRALRKQMYDDGALEPELKAVDKVLAQYTERYSHLSTPIEGHEAKGGLYRTVGSKHYKATQTGKGQARQEAQAAMGRGLRSEVERTGELGGVADVAGQNQQIKDLYDIRELTKESRGMVQTTDIPAGLGMVGAVPVLGRELTRPLPLSYVGRKMHGLGDALDFTSSGVAARAAREEGEATFRGELKTGMAQHEKTARKYADDVASDARYPVERPNDVYDRGADADNAALDRLGIPVERPGDDAVEEVLAPRPADEGDDAYRAAMRGDEPTMELIDPDDLVGPQPNHSGVTDVSREAIGAQQGGWEYGAAGRGMREPRPIEGAMRPEDVRLNPGEQLVRRQPGGRWMPY